MISIVKCDSIGANLEESLKVDNLLSKNSRINSLSLIHFVANFQLKTPPGRRAQLASIRAISARQASLFSLDSSILFLLPNKAFFT